MKRKLSPWCKAVKIAMIQKDWGVADLAQAVKMTKEYTSAVINGTGAGKKTCSFLYAPEISLSEIWNHSLNFCIRN